MPGPIVSPLTWHFSRSEPCQLREGATEATAMDVAGPGRSAVWRSDSARVHSTDVAAAAPQQPEGGLSHCLPLLFMLPLSSVLASWGGPKHFISLLRPCLLRACRLSQSSLQMCWTGQSGLSPHPGVPWTFRSRRAFREVCMHSWGQGPAPQGPPQASDQCSLQECSGFEMTVRSPGQGGATCG